MRTSKPVADTAITTRRIRGPRRLEFIPKRLGSIRGIESLTTLRQLDRLVSYLESAAVSRPPFVRLGATVPPSKRRKKLASTATYAVDVAGEVSVFCRKGDPRRTHIWMQNARRPWNLCRNLRFNVAAILAPTTRIVTLASLSIEEGYMPGWMSDELPSSLTPDGETILRAWVCNPRRDAGGADRAFVVEGTGEWWRERIIPDLASIREAHGEIVSGEVGTLWIGPRGVVEFPAYGYADNQFIPRTGEVEHDAVAYIRCRLSDHLRARVLAAVAWKGEAIGEEDIRDQVATGIDGIDLPTIRLSGVDALQNRIIESLTASSGALA